MNAPVGGISSAAPPGLRLECTAHAPAAPRPFAQQPRPPSVPTKRRSMGPFLAFLASRKLARLLPSRRTLRLPSDRRSDAVQVSLAAAGANCVNILARNVSNELYFFDFASLLVMRISSTHPVPAYPCWQRYDCMHATNSHMDLCLHSPSVWMHMGQKHSD